MLVSAVHLCTAEVPNVANLSGLLFQFLFGFRQIRQDALLHFPSDLLRIRKPSDLLLEAHSARWVGNKHSKFEGSPKVVAHLKHL
jgi:hypothetical protein